MVTQRVSRVRQRWNRSQTSFVQEQTSNMGKKESENVRRRGGNERKSCPKKTRGFKFIDRCRQGQGDAQPIRSGSRSVTALHALRVCIKRRVILMVRVRGGQRHPLGVSHYHVTNNPKIYIQQHRFPLSPSVSASRPPISQTIDSSSPSLPHSQYSPWR